MKKIIYITFLLLIFVSCQNANYFSDKDGKINSENIIRIEYYDSENTFNTDNEPNIIVTDKIKINEISHEINYANNPSFYKGINWERILVVRNDTTIVFRTDGKIIGTSERMYQLKNDKFVEHYFRN